MNNKRGAIYPNKANILPHELSAATILANLGWDVEFIQAKDQKFDKTPDIMMDGVQWEIKSPKTDKLSGIERNLKRASRQSSNIILDGRRIKNLHDKTVQAFLAKQLKEQRRVNRLLYINRHKEVIDIQGII